MDEFSSSSFHDDYLYVTTRLQREHAPAAELGIFDLPEPARARVINIAHFFQNCASYAGYNLLDEGIVLAFVHRRLTAAWDAIDPYVHADRTNNSMTGHHFMGLLEAYAEKARSTSIEEIMAGFLGKRRIAP